MLGKPTIKGTRITVELVLNLIEHGQTVPEIMADYDLTEDQVKAAIEYAQKIVKRAYHPRLVTAHEISIGRKHR